MEALTFWASIASILGLGAAVSAAIKAHGAQRAAQDTRDELRRQQALLLVFDIEKHIILVDNALRAKSWAVCEQLASWAVDQLGELSEYLRHQLNDDEYKALKKAAEALQYIAVRSVHFTESVPVGPSQGEYEDMVARMRGVRQVIATMKGAFRRRIEGE